MLIKKSNLIRIPQSSILYRETIAPDSKFSRFIAVKQIKEPQIGIYLKNLDDKFSEVVIGDTIFVVQNENIFLYREERNVN